MDKRFLLLLLVVLAALVFAGCGSPSSSSTSSPAASAPGAATPGPTMAGPTAIPTPGPNQFVNPVIDHDFPDPDLLQAGNEYYAYATNAGTVNIQSARSSDLVKWEMMGTALPALPLWAKPQGGLTWAPDVTAAPDGKTFIMYYTTRDSASDKQCIGIATADSPERGFRSTGGANDKPLVCNPAEGGDIDPASFKDDDGTRYLLWKNDGNCCNMDTYIYLQRLAGDGLSLTGQPTRLIHNDQQWEGSVVEGPTLWKHGGKYYLFYSANNYKSESYAVGYAVADDIRGPYQKPAKPILTTDYQNGAAFGPGGQDIIEKDGKTWIVYHSWDPNFSYRWVQIDQLEWKGDVPIVDGPNRRPESKP